MIPAPFTLLATPWASGELATEGNSDMVQVVQIAFFNKSLRDLCESESHMKLQLVEALAAALKRRLADLRAATCVTDLVAGNPQEVGTPHQKRFALELSEGKRLLFSSNHVATPVLDSGAVDWSKVSRIKLLRIENSHD